MLEEFKRYVSNYDLDDELIKLKYNHSIRVMELAKKYATLLKFNEEDIYLATLIGLLHDYGRFEQLRVYNSFDDHKTIDHADYGVKVLFDDKEIEKYNIDKKYYDLIKFAIKNHNKLEIEETDNERFLMHAKFIRDVDKIDILYLMGYLGEYSFDATDDEISSGVIDAINEYRSVPWYEKKNNNDYICQYFSFTFNIYNDACLPEIKENIKYLYERINNTKFKKIYDIVNNYIDERIDKNARN